MKVQITWLLTIWIVFHPYCCCGQVIFRAGPGGRQRVAISRFQMEQIERSFQFQRRAELELDDGQNTASEADAREAFSLGGDVNFGYYILCDALVAEGKSREALGMYKKSTAGGTSGQPDNLLPYALLALRAGEWTNAVTAYNNAIKAVAVVDILNAHSHFTAGNPDPNNLETFIEIGLGLTYNSEASWTGRAQNDKALNAYRAPLLLEPSSPIANLYYAHGLRMLGRKAEALAAYKKADSISTGDVKAEVESEMRAMR